LGAIDAMALDVNGTVIEKMAVDQADTHLGTDNLEDGLDELEEAATGPIALAMNVNEAPTDEPSSP
jgi:hypothetical protein